MKTNGERVAIRFAEPGHRCQCLVCRLGGDVGIDRPVFCVKCGHAYIDLRTGRADDAKHGCTKCGSVGQFSDIKPDLPAPPVRVYRVRFGRQVREYAEIEVEGACSSEAVDLASSRARLSDCEWHQTTTTSSPSYESVSLLQRDSEGRNA